MNVSIFSFLSWLSCLIWLSRFEYRAYGGMAVECDQEYVVNVHVSMT